MKTLNQRLSYAREQAGYKSAREFALKHPPMREGTYQSHERPENHPEARTPKNKTVEKYAKLLNVNYIWLLSGFGEMTDIGYPSGMNASVALEVSNFLQYFEKLSEPAKKAVRIAIAEDDGDAKKSTGSAHGLSDGNKHLASNLKKKS